MKRWSIASLIGTVALSALAWAVIAAACLMVGSTGEIGWPVKAIYPYRRELVLLASLVGAALASAGVAYQAILRNPLADPYLLGVSSGAALAVYLWALPPLAAASALVQSSSQQAFAFAGAILAIALVFGLAQRRGR